MRGNYLVFLCRGEDLRVELLVVLLLEADQPQLVVDVAVLPLLAHQLLFEIAKGLHVLPLRLPPLESLLEGPQQAFVIVLDLLLALCQPFLSYFLLCTRCSSCSVRMYCSRRKLLF